MIRAGPTVDSHFASFNSQKGWRRLSRKWHLSVGLNSLRVFARGNCEQTGPTKGERQIAKTLYGGNPNNFKNEIESKIGTGVTAVREALNCKQPLWIRVREP